jgi:hypothetical protein
MGGFKKFEAAKFDERNVAAAELDFEDGAVMARAEQHGLLFQGDARFTVGKHALDGKPRLRGIVANRNERRLFVGASIGSEIFGEAWKAFAGFGGAQRTGRGNHGPSASLSASMCAFVITGNSSTRVLSSVALVSHS